MFTGSQRVVSMVEKPFELFILPSLNSLSTSMPLCLKVTGAKSSAPSPRLVPISLQRDWGQQEIDG